ncbi:MAG: PSD1 and planctomycete cytochrome C domain-containing protein, partial [Pirellulales bacterium]
LMLMALVDEAGAKKPVDFARDIAPIFQRHCIRCHQPANKKSELSLATFDDLAANGYVIPGDPEASHLLEVVTAAADERPLMPKEGPLLSTEQITLLRAWIADGAPWPAGIVVQEQPKADRSWWSLQPLSVAERSADGVPAEWSANPIDRFIFARLATADLRPSAPADRRTLIRRVVYGLTGLPPTPEEVQDFLRDESPDAYEKVVDRLLASPRYGEHWGRHWLDVVRFGESTGFEVNHVIDNAWPFRDYVLRSLNEDKPLNRLIVEHLAGDAVGPGDPAVEIGLTFLVCGPVDIVGNQDAAQAAQIRADTIDEIIRATGEAFLGLTVGCARCHDHKFDPISQRDYYQLYATFAGVYHDDRVVANADEQRDRGEKLEPLESRKKQLLQEIAVAEKSPEQRPNRADLDRQLAELERQISELPALPTLQVGRFEQPAEPQHVHERGDAGQKGEQVVAASLSTLAEVTTGYALAPETPEQRRRLALAEWIVADDNPLTARVLANRVWHHHFGNGLVATPSDFGFMGERPTHPELLDWLARRLVQEGWRLKPLHKLIVTSQTYRQASTYRDDAAAVDADTRLLWRFPPRRLGAEEIRDTMLLLAGKLDERQGGPGFRLYEYSRDNVATYTPLEKFGPETYRRSVYHQNARASRIDLLSDFDAPDCAFSTSRRVRTTTPSQALALLNHSFTMDMAESMAQRLSNHVGTDDRSAQVALAFELAFGRVPTPEEKKPAIALIEQYGLRALCRAILNSSELIYVH